MNPSALFAQLLPAAQVAELREAMEKLKNVKTSPINLPFLTIDPAWLTRIP